MHSKKFFSACQHDCSDNCAIISEIDSNKAVSVRGNPEHPFTRGVLCAKVKNYPDRVYSPERLLYPMRRVGRKGDGNYKRITWAMALKEIKDKFSNSIEKFGAESILPYSYLGHQGLLNGLHCGDSFFNKIGASIGERTFCNSTASKAFSMVAGPTGGLDPESFVHAKLIIIWGMNLFATSMHHGQIVREAIENGAKLVVIDPIKTITARKAHVHLRPRPGTDVALAMCVANYVIQNDLVDNEYIKNHTVGIEKFKLRAAKFDIVSTSGITGLQPKEIENFARLLACEKVIAIRTGVALERTSNGGDAIRAVAALPALIGAWNYRGGGIFQHPQATFPINRSALSNSHFVTKSRRAINLFDIANALGMTGSNKISCLFVYNANPVVTSANQSQLIEKLSRSDLFTVVSEIFHTDTCDYADIILPATSQLEQDDLMYSWGHFNLQLNEKVIEPRGEAISNTELFRRLSKTFGLNDPELFETDDEILEKSMYWNHPNMSGISVESLRIKGFARLNVGSVTERTPHKYGAFPTSSGKFEFYCSTAKTGGQMLPAFRQFVNDESHYPSVDPLPSYKPIKAASDAFTLLSPKHHKLLNSSYANMMKKQGNDHRQIILINPDDAAKLDIEQGQIVRVWNNVGELHAETEVSEAIIIGVVAVYHGLWRSQVRGNTVNALVSSNSSRIGKGITVNDTKVWIDAKL